MNVGIHLGGPLVAVCCLLGGCAVGLDAHPLTDAQSAAISSRAAPDAPDPMPGMTSLVVSVPIDAPVEQVWERLAVRYGDVHQWSGPIEDSDFDHGHVEGARGAVRSCTLGDDSPVGKGETFEETILTWDPQRHYFVAGVDDGFYPMKRAVQEFWVDPSTQGGSIVTTQFHFDLSFPMGKGKGLLGRLKPQMVTSLLGLKHLVETGDSQQAQDSDFLAQAYPSVFDANGV